MQNLALILLAALAFPALAQSPGISCEYDPGGPDGYYAVRINALGAMEIQDGGTIYQVPPEFIVQLPGSPFRTSSGAMVNRRVFESRGTITIPASHVIMDGEGNADEEPAPPTRESVAFRFVYNPAQRAGRLTFVRDGRELLSNKLCEAPRL